MSLDRQSRHDWHTSAFATGYRADHLERDLDFEAVRSNGRRQQRLSRRSHDTHCTAVDYVLLVNDGSVGGRDGTGTGSVGSAELVPHRRVAV